MKQLLPLVTLVVCMSAYATPQKVTITAGFFTGKDYLEMTPTEKRAYATGAINGMLVAPFFGAPEDGVAWLQNCSTKMTDEQVAAILTKYIRDQPGQWHYSLNLLTFNAMRTACPKPRKE